MKLTLKSENGIEILTGASSITVNDFRVLKAGISKIFHAGKNKIILELPDSESISFEVLRELATLNTLARELSGQIVLSSLKPETKAQIASFAQSPVIECAITREEALKFFKPKPQTPTPASSPSADPEKSEAKTQFRSKELSDSTELRKEVERLHEENEQLKKSLHALILRRKDPPDEKSYQQTILNLQEQIEKLIEPPPAQPASK